MILPGSYNEVIYGAIQFIWTTIAIFLLSRIYYSSLDKKSRFIARIFSIALIPWTITLILWKIMLPMIYNGSMAYYVSGFGFLICYGIIVFGLLKLEKFGDRHPDSPEDQMIMIAGALAIIGMLMAVLWNIRPDNPHLLDVLILAGYLIGDVTILCLCVKLAYRNMREDSSYIILTIGVFVLVNLIGDILFELRWLLPVKYVLSYKVQFVINVIYNVSLVFLAIALLLYNAKIKNKSLDKMHRMLDDTRLFVGDVIKQSPDAMCVCDVKGNVVTLNDPFFKIFNVERSYIMHSFNLFEHLNELDGYHLDVRGIMQGEALVVPQVKICSQIHGDRPIYLSIKLFPTSGSDGKISNYVVIFEDITDKVQTNEALKDAKNQAELYVDLMGHDINNINQAALGYLEMAMDKLKSEGTLDKNNINLIAKPYDALTHSSRLIENVRKIRREKSGVYLSEIIDVGKMLEEVKEQYSSIAGREIIINYRMNFRCYVKANELLRDVFMNIVGNAIKHSTGSVTINMLLDKVEENGSAYCTVTIDDNGPGIPDELKRTLFDRLISNNARLNGKGLGLCLTKILIDDFKGKFIVEDRVPGDYTKGARFVVMIPAVEV